MATPTCTLLAAALLAVTLTAALPNTLLEDTKQAVQEAGAAAAAKGEEELPTATPVQYDGPGKTVSQYEKGYQYGVGKAALDKHVENALLKSELYGDPGAVNQYRYYGGTSERKRNQHLTYPPPPPSKRSYRPFVMPPEDLTNARSRLKRDLGLDPDDILTVLSLWQAERQAKLNSNPGLDPAWFSYYGMDPAEEQDEDNIEGNPQADGPGEWLDAPVLHPTTSSQQYHLDRRGGYYYPMYPVQKRQWGGFGKDKRFMVSRKRQVAIPRDQVQTLAQLLNHPYRDPGLPLYRRVVL